MITDGMGLNITVTSYLDNLDVGIIADRDQMPDVNRLVAWLKDGVAELLPPDDKAEPTEGKVQRVATSAQRRRSAPG